LVLIGLYFLKCTKFDQLILRKMIKVVATRCKILTLKCTKIDIGWGPAPDPARGSFRAPPDPWLDLRCLLLRGGKAWNGRWVGGEGGEEGGRGRNGGERRVEPPPPL